MARGTINNDKTKITVPFQGGSSSEEIYRVRVEGTSTADKSEGKIVKSNEAVILHEKRAAIWLSNPGTAVVCGETWNTLDISSLNIRPGTYNVSQYPLCVSNYFIDGDVLYYQTNVSYDSSTDCGVFVVSGIDIYGNVIFSNEYPIDGTSGNEGAIVLSYNGGNVSATTTRIELDYTILNGPITNLSVAEKSNNILAVEITDGHVYLTVPQNASKYTPNEYTISIKGDNQYGDIVVSNSVTVVQDPKDGNSQFYIVGRKLQYPESTSNIFGRLVNENVADIPLGNDSTLYGRRMLRVNRDSHEYGYENSGGDTIERTELSQITGLYDVYFSSLISNVEIYAYSTGIMGIDHSHIENSSETVIAFVEENTTPYERELIIYGSGLTQDGTVVYAQGVITQPPGAYLLICGVTAYVGPDVSNFTQRVTFNYTSKSVTGVTATVSPTTASVSVNTGSKTVTVNFPQNNNYAEKTYKVTLRGRSSVGTEVMATYTFKQTSASYGEFKLVSGNTESTAGDVPYSASTFTLRLTGIPDGMTQIGVFKNESTSGIYKVHNIQIGNGSDTRNVVCSVYPNQGNSDVKYKLQISGVTQNGTVKYSNGGSDFVATHLTSASTGSIEITDLTAQADASSTTYTGEFEYSNLSTIYPVQVDASDNVGVSIDITTASTTGGSFTITFPAWPVDERYIYVVLGGTAQNGDYIESALFTLTQSSSGGAGIRIYTDSTKTTQITQIEVGAEPQDFTYYVDYVNVQSGSPLYNTSVFGNVSNTGARILTSNSTMSSQQYTITFYGTNISTGEYVMCPLTVIQGGESCHTALTISSSESIREGDYYIVSVCGGTYSLYIESTDVDFNSLTLVTNKPNSVSVNTSNQKITFEPYNGGGGSGGGSLTGRVEGDVAYVPVGNNAVLYSAVLSAITKDDESKLSGDTYVYHVSIDPASDAMVTVQLVGDSYCGGQVSSNTLTFIQSGTTAPSEEGGESDCDYTILIRENLTPEANARLDYHGSVTDLILPREECRRAGDSTRFIVFADGYISQIIVDTENLREDVTKDVYLELLSEGQLVVRLLNFSTQHTNHYISYSQVGTTINVTVQPYIASNQYRRCRVSFIVDHDGAYDVNVPDNASEMLEATRGTSTDIWYVQFELEADTTFETFTVSNANTTYTFNVTIGGSSSQSASIQTGLDENPGTVPGSGGSITFVTRFKNVDVDTIGFVPEASEIQSITPDFSTLVDDGNGYYEFTSTAVLTRNTTNTGYQEDCSKYYTVTGTSLLNGSTVSDRQRFWQTAWRELKFYVHSSSQEVYDGETEDSNNMSLDISSWSPYTIDLESVNEWIVFDWDGTHKSGPATENDVYRFDIDYNIGDSRRSCTIYAENQTASQTFTFWQSARALYGCSLSLSSQSPTTVPAAGGEVILTFTYSGFDNPNWTELRYDENDISDATDLNMSGASGTGTVKVTVKPNTTGRTRQVALTIGGNSRAQAKDMSGELYITQAG